jgi:hypothetical protein
MLTSFKKRAKEDPAPTDGMEQQPDKDSSSNSGNDDGSEDEDSESSSDGFANDSVALYVCPCRCVAIIADQDTRCRF